MTYNFDKVVERRGTGSLKWDVPQRELPMWVADMDFETVPEVTEALMQRAAQGVFGYSIMPKEWEESYVNWWKKRHNFEIHPNWLVFTTGVVPAISSAVRKLTTPAEKLGHGLGYKYAHSYKNHYVKQQYLPDGLTDEVFYEPSENGYEQTIREYFKKIHEDPDE